MEHGGSKEDEEKRKKERKRSRIAEKYPLWSYLEQFFSKQNRFLFFISYTTLPYMIHTPNDYLTQI